MVKWVAALAGHQLLDTEDSNMSQEHLQLEVNITL
jgi:hypothetical protein